MCEERPLIISPLHKTHLQEDIKSQTGCSCLEFGMLHLHLAFPRICLTGRSLIKHKMFQKESHSPEPSAILGNGCHPVPGKVTAHTEGKDKSQLLKQQFLLKIFLYVLINNAL